MSDTQTTLSAKMIEAGGEAIGGHLFCDGAPTIGFRDGVYIQLWTEEDYRQLAEIAYCAMRPLEYADAE